MTTTPKDKAKTPAPASGPTFTLGDQTFTRVPRTNEVLRQIRRVGREQSRINAEGLKLLKEIQEDADGDDLEKRFAIEERVDELELDAMAKNNEILVIALRDENGEPPSLEFLQEQDVDDVASAVRKISRTTPEAGSDPTTPTGTSTTSVPS